VIVKKETAPRNPSHAVPNLTIFSLCFSSGYYYPRRFLFQGG